MNLYIRPSHSGTSVNASAGWSDKLAEVLQWPLGSAADMCGLPVASGSVRGLAQIRVHRVFRECASLMCDGIRARSHYRTASHQEQTVRTVDSGCCNRYGVNVLTQRFDRLFFRLVTSFKRYQQVPRSPGDVAAIGSARIDLDSVRNAIANERGYAIGDRGPRDAPRQTAVSDDDLARLRAFGTGFVSG